MSGTQPNAGLVKDRTDTDRPLTTVSLRRRVTIWVLLVLVLVMTAMGLVVNWLLGDALRSDLRQRLEDRAGYAVVLEHQGLTGQLLTDRLTGGGVFSSITAGDKRFIGRDDGPPPVGGRGRPGKPAPAVMPTITYGESDGRLTAVVLLHSGTLTLSTTEADIANTLGRLRQIELLAGAATLLVAGLLLVSVVRTALRPLGRMAVLATRIRDGARGRRLRPTKPTTDLGSTAAAFDDMLDALEAAESRARSAETRMRQFLADASHDLRTPLAGVITGTEMLLELPASRSEREERLVQVVRQARRAARLVDDLLLMTRLDSPAGSGEMAPVFQCGLVDPAFVIGQETELLRMRRPDLIVNVPSDPVGPIVADPDQLQRAFGNLLDNAAAACGPGGAVTVQRSSVDSVLTIRILDSGPGVPEQERERIFDRFFRLNGARSGPGSGLGLPISRAIARAHGGDLVCAPCSSGACFEMTLPLALPVLEPSRLSHGSMPEMPVLARQG